MGNEGDPEYEIQRARDVLTDVRVLRDSDGTDAGAVNPLYYATFHAAQAVLYDRGENPTSHGQVRQLFGQHVVLEGDAFRDQGRLLGDLYDHRREADYGGGTPNVDVTRRITAVAEYVDHMDELVEGDDTGSYRD